MKCKSKGCIKEGNHRIARCPFSIDHYCYKHYLKELGYLIKRDAAKAAEQNGHIAQQTNGVRFAHA